MIDVDVVMAAYGPEPALGLAVETVLDSRGVEVHLVLVDNGCTSDAVACWESHPQVTVARPGSNLGYAGGINHGAALGRSETLVVLNSDVTVEPDALVRLGHVTAEPGVAIAAASVRQFSSREVLNSAGNPLHISGMSWAGSHGQDADRQDRRRAAPIASGAAFAIRRSSWLELGGFWDTYFLYHEDTDLSVRAWQRGWRVEYVPDAVVEHDYDFGRNPRKLAYVERNRLLLLATLFERRTLLLLAPVLLGTEIAVSLWALGGGWFGYKVAGWRWLFRHRAEVRSRRALVAGQRRRSDRELSWLLTARLDAAVVALPAGFLRIVNPVLAAYWALIRTRL